MVTRNGRARSSHTGGRSCRRAIVGVQSLFVPGDEISACEALLTESAFKRLLVSVAPRVSLPMFSPLERLGAVFALVLSDPKWAISRVCHGLSDECGGSAPSCDRHVWWTYKRLRRCSSVALSTTGTGAPRDRGWKCRTLCTLRKWSCIIVNRAVMKVEHVLSRVYSD